MKNLWKLFLRRLKASLSIRITLIIIVVVGLFSSFLTCVINWIVLNSSYGASIVDWSTTLWNGVSGLSVNIGGVGASMLAIVWFSIIGNFLSVEFRAGLISQQIAGGYTRKQIHAAHYLGGLLVAGMTYLAFLVGNVVGFLPSMVAWGPADVGRYIATIPVILFNLVLTYSFVHFCVYFAKGHSAAQSVPIFIVIGLCLFYGLLIGIVPVIVAQVNPEAVRGDGLLWFNRIVALILPVGHVGTAYEAVVGDPTAYAKAIEFFPWHVTFSILIDIGLSVLLFFGGRVRFEKTDLK